MGNNLFKFAGGVRLANLSTSPVGQAGVIYFDTSVTKLRYHDGSEFVDIQAATNEFAANLFRVYDNTDNTKKIDFDASGITTSTVRTITMPDADVDLGGLSNSNIASDAGIALSKLATGTANRLLVNNGSGVPSEAAAITASRALESDANGIPVASSVTATELSYLSGVSSAIQTQLDGKEPSITTLPISKGGTNSGTALNNNRVIISSSDAIVEASAITASRALVSDSNGIPAASSVTSTELGYVSGVSSGIQSQLDDKLDLSGGTLSGFLTLHADPTNALHAAPKQYVDNAINGLKWKESVRAASTGNLTLANEQTVDTVALVADDRVLVKDQDSDEENGIYIVVDGGAWTRSADANTWDELVASAVFVEDGSANVDKGFVCIINSGGTLGTDPVTFVAFSSAGSYAAGNGIDISTQTISVDHDGEGLTFSSTQLALELDGSSLSKSASGLKVASGGITNTEVNASAAIAYSKLSLSDSIVNADINSSAAIAYSKLSLSDSIVNADINSSAAIAYSKLSLSNSILNADINASAAIAESKLSLDYSTSSLNTAITNHTGDTDNPHSVTKAQVLTGDLIVNADVDASAAIALSKLAAVTASRALVSDGSGFVSASSVTSTELGYLSGVSSAIQTQINAKLSSVSGDTTPQLGGNLDLNSKSLLGDMRRADSGTPTRYVTEDYIDAITLTGSTTAVASAFTFDSQTIKAKHIDYTIVEGNKRRAGRLIVVSNNASAAASDAVSIVDYSTETDDVGVSWTAAMNGNNVEISYTTTANDKTMRADQKVFLA